MYSDLALDCFHHTRHAGELAGEGVLIERHLSQQLFSSAAMSLQLDGSVIQKARFKASSTPALIMVCEYLCRHIEGQALHALSDIKSSDVSAALSLDRLYSHYVHIPVRLVHALGQSK